MPMQREILNPLAGKSQNEQKKHWQKKCNGGKLVFRFKKNAREKALLWEDKPSSSRPQKTSGCWIWVKQVYDISPNRPDVEEAVKKFQPIKGWLWTPWKGKSGEYPNGYIIRHSKIILFTRTKKISIETLAQQPISIQTWRSAVLTKRKCS